MALNLQNLLFRRLFSKSLLSVIGFILLLNLATLVIYLHYQIGERGMIAKRSAAQQAVNIIRVVKTTPAEVRKRAVAALQHDPRVSADFSSHPKAALRFDVNSSSWKIYSSLEKAAKQSINISYQLEDGKWLNIIVDAHARLRWVTIILLILQAITVLLVVLYAWSMQRFARPLARLKYAAEHLSTELKAKIVPVSGPSMVQEATEAINIMQQRIEELIKERTLTLAALSHDLKTPLTRLKLRAEFISDQEQQQTILNDIAALENMLQATLTFAKQSYQITKKTETDIVKLVAEICQESQHVQMPVQCAVNAEPFIVLADPEVLKRGLQNLINNAIKYGKQAQLKVYQRGSDLVIDIEDLGPGIPEAEQQKIFTPFYRAEQSRSTETGGSGLGLAIAKSAIYAHHGEISLENLAKGLRVRVFFRKHGIVDST